MSDETEAGTPAESLRRAAQRSRLGSLWRRTAAAVRDSYLYGWLTAEPDPEVIVIDLRETWTVGPFIRLLDATLDRLVPALDDSRITGAARAGVRYTLAAPAVVAGLAVLVVGLSLGLVSVAGGTLGMTRLGLVVSAVVAGIVATRERRSWAELRETRPVELLVAALEPPEPPERSDRSTDGADETDPTPDPTVGSTTEAASPEQTAESDERSRADR